MSYTIKKIVSDYLFDENYGVAKEWMDNNGDHVIKIAREIRENNGVYPVDSVVDIFRDYFVNNLFNDIAPNFYSIMKSRLNAIDGPSTLEALKECFAIAKSSYGMTLELEDMSIEKIWNNIAYFHFNENDEEALEWFEREFKMRVEAEFEDEESEDDEEFEEEAVDEEEA